jgi:hypothetical protein
MSAMRSQDRIEEHGAEGTGAGTSPATHADTDCSVGSGLNQFVAAIVAAVVGTPEAQSPNHHRESDRVQVTATTRRPEPPPPRRLATLFRLVGASQRPLRCATYDVATGIELRIEYEDRDDVVKAELFKPGQREAVATVAASWRRAFDGLGFTELALRE